MSSSAVDIVKTYGIPTGKIEDIVTSTSILINGEAVEHVVDQVKTYGIPTGKIEDIVTSTSVLINGEAVQHAVDLVKTYGISTGKMDLNKDVFTGNLNLAQTQNP
jgi:predicted glycoside hydrolase/deacetylase ChbG (UPF0249 family)